MTAERCRDCGALLSEDEIAITRRLLSRGLQSWWCKRCLAARLKVSPEVIDQKIDQYRAMGCILFR